MTMTPLKPTEIRTELENLGERLNGLRAAERTDESRNEMRSVVEEIGYLDYLYRIEQRKAEIDAGFAPGGGPKGGTARTDEGPDLRTAGQRFVDNDEYRAFADGSGTGHYESEVRTLVDSTGGLDWSTAATNGSGLLRPLGTPYIVPQTMIRQRLFVRDVLDSVNTGLANVPYIQELNAEAHAVASGAAFVNEGAAKPEVAIEFTPADAPIRKLAAWIPATYEILQDASTLRGYIDGRLTYMLAVAEERSILNGNGSAPNLLGLRQVTGKQTQNAVTNDPFATLGTAFGKLEIVYGEPSFVAMNPGDYWATVVGRHANQFDGQAYPTTGSPFNAPPAQVWGVPVIRTNAMETTKALVGSRLGATILDREGQVIRVGDQHSTYFVENKVAILAEKRLGLAIHRPDWFVEATLSLP